MANIRVPPLAAFVREVLLLQVLVAHSWLLGGALLLITMNRIVLRAYLYSSVAHGQAIWVNAKASVSALNLRVSTMPLVVLLYYSGGFALF